MVNKDAELLRATALKDETYGAQFAKEAARAKLTSRGALEGRNPRRKKGPIDSYGPKWNTKNRTFRKKWAKFAGCNVRLLSLKEEAEMDQKYEDERYGV